MKTQQVNTVNAGVVTVTENIAANLNEAICVVSGKLLIAMTIIPHISKVVHTLFVFNDKQQAFLYAGLLDLISDAQVIEAHLICNDGLLEHIGGINPRIDQESRRSNFFALNDYGVEVQASFKYPLNPRQLD